MTSGPATNGNADAYQTDDDSQASIDTHPELPAAGIRWPIKLLLGIGLAFAAAAVVGIVFPRRASEMD